MEFRLLGPVEVLDDGMPVPLGGRQRRTTLSILLVHAGEPVSTDRLIGELWGDEPPEAARKTVQAHVAHLRKALNVDGELLSAADDGYVMHVDPASIDVKRFEQMVGDGRSLRSKEPRRSAEKLAEALGLFRGAPLSGMADDAFSLRVEASRIEEIRLAAVEDRLDARLAAGDGADVIGEVERLVAEHPLRERLWALLVLALYRAGRQGDALRAFTRVRQVLAAELGIDPSPELRSLEQRILEHDPTLAEAPVGVASAPLGAPSAVRNPYKGLRAFDEADAADFFGRDDLVRRLLERLTSRRGGQLVVLAGPSGAGKSSAVRAGLIPELHRDGWEVAVMFPGRDPFGALMKAVTEEVSGDTSADMLDRLEAGRPIVDEPLIVVVDQFEELFTMADPGDADQFLGLLAEGSGSTRWVVTVRADFLDSLLSHPLIGSLLEETLVLVPPLQDHEVSSAVVQPAQRVGVDVEPELVSEIARDIRARPAALPLLQYALTETFERRRGQVLTLADYQRAGGISGALARRADELYQSFDLAQREAVRQLLLLLVSVTNEGEEVRRRVDRRSLMTLSVDGGAMQGVLERLGAQRLLTFDQDPDTGHPTVEVAHEALIAEWPRLARWVDDARDDLRLRDRLAAVIDEWEGSGREHDFLMRAVRLTEMESWAAGARLQLTGAEREFLAASRQVEDAELTRRRRRRRVIAALLSAAAVIAAVSAVAAFLQANDARNAARLATVRELAAASVANLDVDPELSLLLALEAVNESGEFLVPEADEALHRAVLGTRLLGRVNHQGQGIAHFAADGRSFVTSGEDPATAVVWSTDTDPFERELVLTGHSDDVIDAVFNLEGTRIATTSVDGTVRVWDSATGETELVFEAGPPTLIPVFSVHGSLLAASSEIGTVWVWDLSTQEVLWTLIPPDGTRRALNLEFSPDGSLLAVAPQTDPEVVEFGAHIWDMTTGELVKIVSGHDWDVQDVGFTPDGSMLVTGSFDTTLKVWNVETWENIRTFFGHKTSVFDLEISADGTKVASSGTNEALVWDLATTETLASVVGHRGVVDGIDLSPDGSYLLTASLPDGTTRLWDLTPYAGHELFGFPSPPGAFSGVDFSPEGRIMAATRDYGGLVTLWDSHGGEEIRTVEVPADVVESISFAPDGNRLALGGPDGLWLLDLATEHVTLVDEAPFATAVFSQTGMLAFGNDTGAFLMRDPPAGKVERLSSLPPYSLAIDPGERLIAMSLDDGESGVLQVLDLSTGANLGAKDHGAPVFDIAFSPDREWFVAGSLNGIAIVWDSATLEPVRRLEGHSGQIFGVDVHPTRPEVATSSDDGTIKIWNVETGAVRLSLPGGPFSTIRYSQDGRYLAATGPEGGQVFIMEVQDLVAEAQSRLTRWWTEGECVQYLHTEQCPIAPQGLKG